MGTMFEVGAALLGACVGSFLNVVIWRLQQEDPRRRSLGGRSHCPHCGALIRWFHNIPVVSWLVLRARAHCCGKPIAWRYPLVEALTAGLFLVLALWPPFGPVGSVAADGRLELDSVGAVAFGLHAVFLSLLVALSFIDFDTQLLPDVLTKPGIAIGIAAGFWPGLAGMISDDSSMTPSLRGLLASIVGACAGGGVTWLIRAVGSQVFRREAMGFGDVKLMGMVGAFLGWQAALLTMMLGCVFGAVVGGLGALRGGGTQIPFGPYLAMGAVVSMFLRAPIVTFLFTTWPEWQRDSAAAPFVLGGSALVSLVLLFWLVRRARRTS
jgi:leader peptidase (prepilin peptidase)/N-methyltransferase